MKVHLLLAMLASPLLLAGCFSPLIVEPLVEGTQQGYDAGRRDSLLEESATGDPVAQYKLGDTYCCRGGGPLEKLTVYDNPKATFWYCKAARQGYAPAQLRLAQVYSGHPIHGIHIALRASALVGTVETDLGIALLWASVAATGGDEDAVSLRDDITQKATDKERAKSSALMKNWRAAPCQWAEVFPPVANAK